MINCVYKEVQNAINNSIQLVKKTRCNETKMLIIHKNIKIVHAKIKTNAKTKMFIIKLISNKQKFKRKKVSLKFLSVSGKKLFCADGCQSV